MQQDILDKFHLELAKLDAFKDILESVKEAADQKVGHEKHMFYSTDEYTNFQKQNLNSELKYVADKNFKRILPYQQDSTRTGYELIHANTTGKFLVFELSQVVDP